MSKATILIVEDDDYIVNILRSLLEANEYRVIYTSSGKEALHIAACHLPDIVLLDLGLPDIDGIEVIKSIRKWFNGSLIIVSARNREMDKVQALDLGADDYINKPFSASELLARIRVALRQAKKIAAGSCLPELNYMVGELTVDFRSGRVFVNQEDARLTRLEYRIVELLARNPGKVLTHDYIIRSIWGPYASSENNLILRVNIANIRRKIENNHTPHPVSTTCPIIPAGISTSTLRGSRCTFTSTGPWGVGTVPRAHCNVPNCGMISTFL
jgi:two-component system KDP operon response regulator KdpE